MPGNGVIGKDVVLIGQDVVAKALGVSSQAVSNWYKRQDESGIDWGMPEPRLVQFTPGKTPRKIWQTQQLPAWLKWHQDHLAERGNRIPEKQRKAA